MTIARMEIDGHAVAVDLSRPFNLAIPLAFDAGQPRFFGAPPAHREPLSSGDWIGDTRQGGSCNAAVLTLTPHCNGTHTECIGHVVDQDIPVSSATPENLTGAWLASIEPELAGDAEELDNGNLPAGQRVITRRQLQEALKNVPARFLTAIVLRTLPNDPAKRTRDYGDGSPVPFLTPEAADYLVHCGCDHILVDLPSLDFGEDPELRAHRVFFGLPPGSHDYRDSKWPGSTITEMIFVDDEAEDGAYLLNLQVPAFLTDAAPSRPLIYRVTEE